MNDQATIRIDGIEAIQKQITELADKIDRLISMSDDGDLWTVPDVAKFCRVSEDTVRRWAREGSIEVHSRLGKNLTRLIARLEAIEECDDRDAVDAAAHVVRLYRKSLDPIEMEDQR